MVYNVSIYNTSQIRTGNSATPASSPAPARVSAQPCKPDFPRRQDFPRNRARTSGGPPNSPLGLRETPFYDPSGLPSPISAHTASPLPCGYPQLHGRGYHSFPGSSGDISISHLGVSRGHQSVPHTSHCISKATPDSSGFRRPPSRTPRHYNVFFPQ